MNACTKIEVRMTRINGVGATSLTLVPDAIVIKPANKKPMIAVDLMFRFGLQPILDNGVPRLRRLAKNVTTGATTMNIAAASARARTSDCWKSVPYGAN